MYFYRYREGEGVGRYGERERGRGGEEWVVGRDRDGEGEVGREG